MRPAILSNGNLCVTFDRKAVLRELFFPIVGLSNHVRHGEGTETFLYRDRWEPVFDEADRPLATYGRGMFVTWKPSPSVSLPFECFQDALDPYVPVWVRSFVIAGGSEDFTLFFRHRYGIGENTVGEGAAWCPEKRRLYHYKGKIWIAHSLFREETGPSSEGGMTGELRMEAAVAKVRDGGVRLLPGPSHIQGRSVDHGCVESAIAIVGPVRGPVRVNYVVALGSTRDEADRVMDETANRGFSGILERQLRYWELHMLAPGALCRSAGGSLRVSVSSSPEESTGDLGKLEYLYNTSVLISHAHWSHNGAVVASCDDDIMTDYRDHYRYVWPRDAAMIAQALLRCGMVDVARTYLEFAARCVDREGFFWQRYRPDGTMGSGWHPWSSDRNRLPVQTDETSLTLVLAGDYLDRTGDLDTVHSLYSPLIKPAAEFLLSHRSPDGRTVMPSYDLWEERHGIFAFTQAAQAAGLHAAARISRLLGFGGTEEYANASYELVRGLVECFGGPERGIVRGVHDETEDASLFLVPILLARCSLNSDAWGLPGHLWEMLVRTRKRAARSLFSGGGMARYPGDWYWRPADMKCPGNPWVVTTAWYLKSGLMLGVIRPGDLLEEYAGDPGTRRHGVLSEEGADDGAGRLPVRLDWFLKVSSDSGAFPEQVHAKTLEPLSVMPLAWSHGCFLDLLRDLLRLSAFLPDRESKAYDQGAD